MLENLGSYFEVFWYSDKQVSVESLVGDHFGGADQLATIVD